MDLPIDPTQINHDNLPTVVGTMLVMIHDDHESIQAVQRTNADIKTDVAEIRKMLDEYGTYVGLLKFSRCNVWPWICRHRYGVAGSVTIASLWISALDWLNRWLQWSFLPPGQLP